MKDAYNEALALAAERAVSFLENLADRSTGVSEAALAKLNEFDPRLPMSSTQAVDVVRQLDELGSDSVIPNMGGRFFGGVIGGAVPASVATRWLADVWDQNACAFEFSPIGAHLEALALRWVRELLSLPATTFGVLVGGTQTADITCLAAARHDILSRSGWDVEADGLRGAPDIPVIVADQAHATIFKALSILGLGTQRVHRVPTDEQGRMIVDRFPPLDKPSIVCVQAGNVNTGCFDNFRAIAEIAEPSKSWIHVDGAFGLWAAASEDFAQLTAGCDLAHSWALDAHKWLNVSYDCGIALVRDARPLAAAMKIAGSYYGWANDRFDAMRFSIESSRRARGIELWATVRSLGQSGIRELLGRTHDLAVRFAGLLWDGGFQLLNDVCINQVLATVDAPRSAITDLVKAVRDEGVCWIGETVWKGRPAFRISVSSWATTSEDVDRSAESIIRLARQRGLLGS